MSTRIKETRKQLLEKLEQANVDKFHLENALRSKTAELEDTKQEVERIKPFVIEHKRVHGEHSVRQLTLRYDEDRVALGHKRELFREVALRMMHMFQFDLIERELKETNRMWGLIDFLHAMWLCDRMGVEVRIRNNPTMFDGKGGGVIETFDRLGRVRKWKDNDFPKLIKDFSQQCITGKMFR